MDGMGGRNGVGGGAIGRAALAATACVLTAVGSAHAGPVFAGASGFAALFVTLCVDNEADPGRVATLAGNMGLHPVAADDPSLAPGVPGRRAWHLATADGSPVVLGISKGESGGKAVTACSLSGPTIASRAAEDVLVARLGLGRAFRVEPLGRETVTYWHLPGGSYGSVIAATDLAAVGQAGINLALTVQR